jgi:hypothetical protein
MDDAAPPRHDVRATSGDLAAPTATPGKWQGHVELALLEAVFGAHDAEVAHVIQRWRARRDAGDLDDLNRIAACSSGQLVALLGGDFDDRVPDVRRANAVGAAARSLSGIGAAHATTITGNQLQRRMFTSVPGLGDETWKRLLTLLGIDTTTTRIDSRIDA